MSVMSSPVQIIEARSASDLTAVAGLFRAYAASLPIDLHYQDFEHELASLPGRYGPPRGALMLARGEDGEPLGCVALRPFDHPQNCEMKRLYVDPAARGLALGRRLAEAIVAHGRRLGYDAMLLDTLGSMTRAKALYESLGFTAVPPYYHTPVAGTVFLRLKL